MAEIDIAHLRQWIGRTDRQVDVLAPAHAAAMAATLDVAAPAEGAPLPPLWHWAYFTPRAPLAELGADGHPRLGGFMPPIPLPRRMWVGGRFEFRAPLAVGAEAVRTTTIHDATAKSGRSGTLVFVTLRHEIAAAGGVALVEEQDLVYRAPAPATAPASAPPPVAERRPADWRDAVVPGPVMLFRYSAVTFNSHRIHYDEPYAREEEGYPGLVVHGPLTATLLAGHLMRRTGGTLAQFSFRAERPLFAGGVVAVCGKAAEAGRFALWAETPGGETAMSAEARLAG